jgi:DNA sulfur modification protein DndB
MSYGYTYTFPALRGIQAGREYFVAMCPLKLLPRIFLFDEAPLPPELRAQRTLNTARVPDIARYVLENQGDYAFSAITASIDGEVRFEPAEMGDGTSDVGRLTVQMTARFVINDGQHRRAAIEKALEECPELGDETIAVVFFLDTGLGRTQQLFADLNKHAVRPTKSLGILYDHRDPMAKLCRRLIDRVDLFKGLTETEKTSISNRSRKLFTLSSIYQATAELLKKKGKSPEVTQAEEKLAAEYWETLGDVIPEWRLAKERRVSAGELRRDYVHVHGVVLQALGRVGAALLAQYPEDWQERLEALATLDWARANVELWEGRAMVHGRIRRAKTSITLTVNVLKAVLGLPLTPEEKQLEDDYHRRQMLDRDKGSGDR